MKKNFKVLICERKQSNSAQYIIQTAHFCSTCQENEKVLDVRDIFCCEVRTLLQNIWNLSPFKGFIFTQYHRAAAEERIVTFLIKKITNKDINTRQ